MNQAPIPCPTKSVPVSRPYAARRWSRGSKCTWTYAGSVSGPTEEVSGDEQLPPMKDKLKCVRATMVTDGD